jgi:hypothetical protein
MEAILARRFTPFDFSAVPGYPNLVPHTNEWQGYLPKFKEGTYDNHVEHLLEFHELMHHLDISHEDVLMKMFMYSLEGDAREWYQSLPPSSISSLYGFHTTFHHHCKRYFSVDLLFEHCCEEFGSYIQQSIINSSNSENERDIFVEEVEEDSITYESSSNYSFIFQSLNKSALAPKSSFYVLTTLKIVCIGSLCGLHCRL